MNIFFTCGQRKNSASRKKRHVANKQSHLDIYYINNNYYNRNARNIVNLNEMKK